MQKPVQIAQAQLRHKQPVKVSDKKSKGEMRRVRPGFALCCQTAECDDRPFSKPMVAGTSSSAERQRLQYKSSYSATTAFGLLLPTGMEKSTTPSSSRGPMLTRRLGSGSPGGSKCHSMF